MNSPILSLSSAPVKPRPHDVWTSPRFPDIRVYYRFDGEADPVDIRHVQIEGLILSQTALAFLREHGFDEEGLNNQIHDAHPRGRDADSGRD